MALDRQQGTRIVGYLDIISLADNGDVALEVTFRTTVNIIRICQHRPLVIKLMICTTIVFTAQQTHSSHQTNASMSKRNLFDIDSTAFFYKVSKTTETAFLAHDNNTSSQDFRAVANVICYTSSRNAHLRLVEIASRCSQ